MQLQSCTQQAAKIIPQTFCVVLCNHGKARKDVVIEEATTFNNAMDKARHFPLMAQERITVYRGAFGKGGGLRETYTRTAKSITL